MKYRFQSEQGGRCLIYERGENGIAVATCYNVGMADKIVNALNAATEKPVPAIVLTIDTTLPPNTVVFVHPDGRRQAFKVKP